MTIVIMLTFLDIEGNLGKQANRLIKIWANENQSELALAWEKAIKGEKLPWVTPLR